MDNLFDITPLQETTTVKPDLKEFTVSEISFEIKRFVETTFNRVRIKGEIFGGKRADSGHWYLSLKRRKCHAVSCHLERCRLPPDI